MLDVFEVEAKFPLADLPRLERELAALGAVFGPEVSQVDRYYAHPARDFAQTDEALRIRRVGDANFVTYKGPKLDPQTKTRRELELVLPSGEEGAEQFAALLEALGFRPVAEVRKRRRHAKLLWQEFPFEIARDEVEGVGRFVELEVSAGPDTLDAARSALAALAERLGLYGGERRSYLELLLSSQGSGFRVQNSPSTAIPEP
jgi:adenylate cyclase class 2